MDVYNLVNLPELAKGSKEKIKKSFKFKYPYSSYPIMSLQMQYLTTKSIFQNPPVKPSILKGVCHYCKKPRNQEKFCLQVKVSYKTNSLRNYDFSQEFQPKYPQQ